MLDSSKKEFYRGALLAALGQSHNAVLAISDHDRMVLTQEDTWLQEQWKSVENALGELCWGSARALGFGKTQMPAEYIATCIVVGCHPRNWLIACSMMADQVDSKLTEIAGYEQQREPITRKALWAMCVLAGGQYPHVESQIENKLRSALELKLEQEAPQVQ